MKFYAHHGEHKYLGINPQEDGNQSFNINSPEAPDSYLCARINIHFITVDPQLSELLFKLSYSISSVIITALMLPILRDLVIGGKGLYAHHEEYKYLEDEVSIFRNVGINQLIL